MPQTVLILEDEATIRENLTAFLEDEGFKVLEAPDAKAAFVALSTQQPDLAIVDIRLPDMDGNQWMLEAHQKNPQLKLIVYTGLLEYKPSESLKKIGLQESDVLYKPVESMDDITQLIRQKLAG